MKILVTGAAGFMGSWLVDELLKRGHQVVGVDDLSGGFLRNVNKGSKFVRLDLRDTKKTLDMVKRTKPKIIFHLAAYAAEGQSVFSPIQINDINISPMNNLLVAAVNEDVDKFVFTSSMAVYGNQKPPFDERMPRRPEDPYGCSKTYCERMLEVFSKIYGLRYTILRPHNVYGPRQNILDPFRNVLAIWINRVMRGKPPIIYGDGRQRRAFSYIGDITAPMANAGLHKKVDNRIINLGSDEVVTINKACSTVLQEMGSKLKPIHAEERPGEVKYAWCTVGHSKKILGYKTEHHLKEGVQKTIAWARHIGPQNPTYRVPLEIHKNVPSVWRDKVI